VSYHCEKIFPFLTTENLFHVVLIRVSGELHYTVSLKVLKIEFNKSQNSSVKMTTHD